MNVNKAGLWGEVYAARFLRDSGYDIIAGNYRCRMGEIDIIAGKDGVVCFVEVKTRGEDPMFRPMEAVDHHKRKRLVGAAQNYIRYEDKESPSRFDVIEITLDGEYKLLNINHIKDAFSALD
ncbi:MAG: YraN family protein [Clostridia bacterium]|nr:YraN family protein [Clostridia bacterium]